MSVDPGPSSNITSRYLAALVLLIICTIHAMIFTFFQTYGNFLNQAFLHILVPLKVFFYSIVVLTSISHQFLVRITSLKTVFIAGLSCNILGLALIWWSISFGGILPIIFLSMFFIGLALTSVFNSIITYLIIEFPTRIGAAILVMFIFGDAGNMISELLFRAFGEVEFAGGFFLLTIGLMVASILYIGFKFFTPLYPPHLEHLRKGTLLWKELHYRLVFFILSIIAYGAIESVFGVWSGLYLLKFLSQAVTKTTLSFFWFSNLICKLIMLVTLYFYSARRVFPFLILTLIFTMFFYERQTQLAGFAISLALGGIGCAAIFPFLLTFMEQEVIDLCTRLGQNNFLPYIETGTCLMVGGYFLGIGIVDIWVLTYINHPTFPLENVFHWAIVIVAGIGLLSTYLNWSSSADNQ